MAHKGRPKGSHDIAPIVRGAFLRACKMVESRDKRSLAEIMADLLRDDPKACLDAVSKFVPKEMLIEQTTEVKVISGDPMDVEAWENHYLAKPETRPN